MDKTVHPGITNIGRKPTIRGEHLAGVETYIYGWDRDIYGKEIEVRLLSFMRPERRFGSIEELKRQVLSDKEEGRKRHEEKRKRA